MNISVGSIVVIDSIFNCYFVAPSPFRVESVTQKSIIVTALNLDGTVKKIGATKQHRKTSVVDVLQKIEDFAPYHQKNQDLYQKFIAYTELNSKLKDELRITKSKTLRELEG